MWQHFITSLLKHGCYPSEVKEGSSDIKRKKYRSWNTKAAEGWCKRNAATNSLQFCFNARHKLYLSKEKPVFQLEGQSIDFGVEVENLEAKETKNCISNGEEWRAQTGVELLHRSKLLHHTCSLPDGFEVEVILRPTVSRPVRLGVRHPSGTSDQFFFLLQIFFRQLRVCYFLAPSLTWGRVCNLLLMVGLASAVPFVSEYCGTLNSILLSQSLGIHPTWRARFPYLYPPGTRWPEYTPGHFVPFLWPLTARRATVELF
jgi:hypothetical protein